MTKRLLALAVAIVMLVTLFAACGQKTGTEQSAAPAGTESAAVATEAAQAQEPAAPKIEGEIEFMTYRDDLLNTWWPAKFDEFKAKYPDVKITTSTSKNFDQDFRVRLSSNDVPDVFTIMADRYSDAQRSQFMLPLNDVFPDMVNTWEYNGNNVNQEDQKTYGLTYGGQSIGLAYNKKIFADLGLQPPKTLDEVIAAGKAIKAKGLIGFTGTFQPRWTMQPYYWTAQALLENQTDTFNKMVQSDTPFTMDSPYGKMMEVLQKLSKAGIMEDDPASYNWEPYLKDAGSNKIGMAFTWTNTPCQWPGRGDGSMKLEDIGFVPFPYDNSGGPHKALVQADWSVCIAKNSDNPEAAKAFFAFHMNDIYGDYAKETAILSAKQGFVTDVPYLKEFDAAKPVMVNAEKYPNDFRTRMDKAQINLDDPYVEVGVGVDIQKVLDKLNTAWKKAKN
jgi:ABC-type glycerol-3-phosphate transport system substrate-binding protein